MVAAIPTEYGGVRFRSRLEAQWAHLFDRLKWPWKYEPIDLAGYIPDFVLPFKHGDKPAPLLVEVKPALYKEELYEHRPKIEDSGWDHEALIVGSSPMIAGHDSGYPVLGSLAERRPGPDDESIWCWSEGVLHWCRCCGKWSMHHDQLTWFCRTSGCYEGDHFLGQVTPQELSDLWKGVANNLQWHPSTRRWR